MSTITYTNDTDYRRYAHSNDETLSDLYKRDCWLLSNYGIDTDDDDYRDDRLEALNSAFEKIVKERVHSAYEANKDNLTGLEEAYDMLVNIQVEMYAFNYGGLVQIRRSWRTHLYTPNTIPPASERAHDIVDWNGRDALHPSEFLEPWTTAYENWNDM